MGGLTAALKLVRLGFRVQVLEARAEAGGLAGGFELDGLSFDAGPYLLLDRAGLEWAFRSLGLELAERVDLRRVEHIYEVSSDRAGPIRFYADLAETAAGFDRAWPGSGQRYVRFIRHLEEIHAGLRRFLYVPRPTLGDLVRARAWNYAPFLARSLGSVLARSGLPSPVLDAIAIWTHVAGQPLKRVPSSLAFLPMVIHSAGAFYPVGGMGGIPRALATAAAEAGVEFRYGTAARTIRTGAGRVRGVETERGELVEAEVVVSNASGVGTYLDLLDASPRPLRERLARLRLQSPGVCAYLAVQGGRRSLDGAGDGWSPYLRFCLPGSGQHLRCLVGPWSVAPELERDGWWPARLMGPTEHGWAERVGPAGQQEYLDRLLAEVWWRGQVGEVRVLRTRIPADWGAEYRLHRDSMNPVRPAGFMGFGPLAHRSPTVRGLYLAGSSTHPGYSVSFCAISGILAAQQVGQDLS